MGRAGRGIPLDHEVPLSELWQRFQPEKGQHGEGSHRHDGNGYICRALCAHGPCKCLVIDALQPAEERGPALDRRTGQEQQAQRRRDGQRNDRRGEQGQYIGEDQRLVDRAGCV